MAEDRLKQDANESFSDQLFDIGTKAAAVSIAAAFAYRAGGARILSKKLNELSDIRNEVIQAVCEHRMPNGEALGYLDYDHLNRKTIPEAIEAALGAIKRHRHDDGRIRIDVRPGTAIEGLISYLNQSSDYAIDNMLQEGAYIEQVQTPVLNLVRERLSHIKGVGEKERRDADLFVRKMLQNAKPGGPDSFESKNDIAKYRRYLSNDAKGRAIDKVMKEAIDTAIALNKKFSNPNTGFKSSVAVREKIQDRFLAEVLGNAIPRKYGMLGDKSYVNLATGDRGITYGELVQGIKDGKIKDFKFPIGGQNKSFLETVEAFHERLMKRNEEAAKNFYNTYADPLIRTNGKDIYSFRALGNIRNAFMSKAAGTIPGKILKLRTLQMNKLVPSVFRISKGVLNPTLAAFEQSNDLRIHNNYYALFDKIYRVNTETGELDEVEELKNGFSAMSMQFGGQANLLKDIMGLGAERVRTNWFFRQLGLNAGVGSNIWESIPNTINNPNGGFLAGNPDDVVSILKTYKGVAREENVYLSAKHAAIMSDFFNSSTRGLSNRAISELSQLGYADKSINGIFDTIINSRNDQELAEAAMRLMGGRNDTELIYNARLERLISGYMQDPIKTKYSVELINSADIDVESGAMQSLNFEERLRKELLREALLRIAKQGSTPKDEYTALKYFIEHSGLSAENQREAKELGYSSLLDDKTDWLFSGTRGFNNEKDQHSIEEVRQKERLFEDIVGGWSTSEGKHDASEVLSDLVNDNNAPGWLTLAKRNSDADIHHIPMDAPYVITKKSTSILDLLGSINQSIKEESLDAIKDVGGSFIKQFTAGRDNMGDVNPTTLIPYFFLRRLGSSELPPFLQWSNDDLKSTGAMAKTLGKRIAAVGIGATMLEWADDTVGLVTGTRASAGFVNGLDYMDIGARRILDATSASTLIEGQMYTNPIFQYWFGKDGYYDADQQRDYYANGYDPVRSGRYWNFGSVNELRGSKIQYFEPNLTRRLNSDYYNKSLYSSYWDKWSHSIMPTPLMPFSPLVYLADPYYLEREHYEDRPYTTTGTMFEKDTPWGIVLNPTVGELVKPVQKMHQDRLYDGVDAKALIYEINKHIRNTADERHTYTLAFDKYSITPQEYTNLSNPALGETTFKIEPVSSGYHKAQSQPEYISRDNPNYSNIASGDTDISSGGGNSPINMLGRINAAIQDKAVGYTIANGQARGTSGYTDDGSSGLMVRKTYSSGGILTPDRLRYSHIEDMLRDEDLDDLINASTGQDLIKQATTSFRLISGIYGYGANRAFGFGEADGKQMADAGDIDSFSRSFWDASIGGLGGETSEIARRFIPEFRRGVRRNPLMNTMPDWMSERFRMGDPYTLIPKGEARLPGKGYEALNPLHPDQFGTYGAFDRYKILADVDPSSAEFRIWKKIANITVKDPQLRQQMTEIQDRVNEVNKQHDFYDYKLIGNDVDYIDATVTEVNNNGTFRIKGSDDLYRIAGVDFGLGQNLKMSEDSKAYSRREKQIQESVMRLMSPGSDVTLAVNSNPYHQHDSDGVGAVSAAVFVDGTSVAEELIDQGYKKRRKDTDITDFVATTGASSRLLGEIGEFIAHSDLPMLHDRYLRVRDPLESYNAEQVYGTPYQTWSDITGTFLMPAIERAASDHYAVIKNTAMYFTLMAAKNKDGIGYLNKKILSGASLFLNRGGFWGGAIAAFMNPENPETFARGTKIGTMATMAVNMYTSARSGPIESAASWAQFGWMAGDLLDENRSLAEILQSTSIAKRIFRNIDSVKLRGKFALAGAAAGVVANGIIGNGLLSDGRDEWVPERVQKKWDLEDYFDRLNYIKYMGLYNKAKEKAKSEEGTDLDKIFADYDKYQEKRREIIEDSDVNNDSLYQTARRRVNSIFNTFKRQFSWDNSKWQQEHRFEYDNGFSINDLPGVRNGVFHSDEVSPEERLYTLNALVSMGVKYNKHGTSRTEEDRDMTQLTAFEHVYHTKVPKGYEVHHIVEFSENGVDNPANMIALSSEDHLYITEQQKRIAAGETLDPGTIGQKTAMELGEYGRSALLYKQAAESTMYGLRADARWTDVVKALPRYERDYFTEFMKEKDPDKREEILKSVSPFLRRALKQVWGMDYEKDKGPSNEEYFQNHNLPNFLWDGWNPDSDLNNVKAKTIKNEGLLFSDFGIFESQYRDQKVINAPNLSPKGTNNPIEVQGKLAMILNGTGLTGVDVSVEPKSTKGVQSVINLTKVIDYKIHDTINNMFT